MKTVTVYTVTQAEEKSGPASISVVLLEGKKTLVEKTESIGNASRSYAEYVAVLRALEMLVELYGARTTEMRFEVCLTSDVVKRQLCSEVPVTEPGLVPYFMAIHNMRVASFPFLSVTAKKL